MAEPKIIGTFLISQFLFVCSAIATPQKVYNLVNSLTFKFIWKSKTERMKRNVLIKDCGRGELKIPDFKSLVETAQIKWIRKIKGNHAYYWKSILKSYLVKLNVDGGSWRT